MSSAKTSSPSTMVSFTAVARLLMATPKVPPKTNGPALTFTVPEMVAAKPWLSMKSAPEPSVSRKVVSSPSRSNSRPDAATLVTVSAVAPVPRVCCSKTKLAFMATPRMSSVSPRTSTRTNGPAGSVVSASTSNADARLLIWTSIEPSVARLALTGSRSNSNAPISTTPARPSLLISSSRLPSPRVRMGSSAGPRFRPTSSPSTRTIVSSSAVPAMPSAPLLVVWLKASRSA